MGSNRALGSEDTKEIAFSLLDLLRETQFVPLVSQEALQVVSRCIEVLPMLEVSSLSLSFSSFS